MNIDWRIKRVVFKIISITRSYDFLYFLQKYITRAAKKKYLSVNNNWLLHSNAISSLIQKEQPVRLIEFGAGRTLVQNIYLGYTFKGRLNQDVVDLYPMLDVDLLVDANRQISNLVSEQFVDLSLDENRENFGINYYAPLDIAGDGDVGEEYDICISTNTLEHIPEKEITRIFNKLKKILKKGGLISAKIDYTDHYSYTDKKLSPLNFLKYDDNVWKKFSPDIHFQNRLRHQDYRELFNSCGFKVLDEKILRKTDLRHKLDSKFDAENEETYYLHGYFLLQKVS